MKENLKKLFNPGKALLVILLVLFHFTVLLAQPMSFSSDSVISTGYRPFALACADFNHDDAIDIATTMINELISDPVAVFINDGYGKMAIEADSLYLNPDDPKGIAVGDLNNDQEADLAVAIQEDSIVVLLFGNGDGTFTRGTDVEIPTKPVTLVIADFDKDMNNDLAVASHYGFLLIYEGDGLGSFSETVRRTGVGSVQDLETTDMNKDGYTDLLIGTGNVHAVELFLNDGAGNFPSHNNLATYRPSWHVKPGDFNKDGYPDIAAGSGSWDFDNVYVLLGDEAGEYSCPDTLSPASYVDDISVADYNNDSNPDVLIADRNGIFILSGNGDGHFSQVDTIDYNQGDYQANAAESVDLNNDGRLDIVVARDQQISIYYNTGTYTSIKHEESKMMFFELFQNYPNPFNPSTIITFQLPENSHVNLDVFDILGQRVLTLVNDQRNAGMHTVEFDGAGLCSGTYFYKLKAGRFFQMRKMVYMR